MGNVVVFDPSGDLRNCRWYIRDRTYVEVVPFEGLHESLGGTVAFRTSHGR